MPPIRSSEIACAQRSCVGHRENALQPLDFSNALFGVDPSQYLAERQGGQFGAIRSAESALFALFIPCICSARPQRFPFCLQLG
jgi:hypothetical protein